MKLQSGVRIEGTVLWWDARDGNGIIEDAEGFEYYSDISVTLNRTNLKRGQKVIFELNNKIKDCRCACAVEVK